MKHTTIEVIELAAVVDQLAALKAQVAPLEERMELLKDQLKASGRSEIDGTLHTAKISLSEPEVLDRKRLRADLGEAVWKEYTKPGQLVISCKLYARKTK